MDHRFRFYILLLVVGMALAGPGVSQTPDEHAKHHPAPGGATPPPAAGMPMPVAGDTAAGGTPGGAAPAGGMGAMMGKMMTPPPSSAGCAGGDCGSAAAQTPIYPSLMTLPALTPEKRAELDALATQQINEGMSRLSKGVESLDSATQAGDEAAMQQSVGIMHEALNETEAGFAARRVLSEGKAPRNLALDWFKREMNLASPVVRNEPLTLVGLPPMHFFTMALLVAFAFAMLAMYFFKMRRAAALFGRVEPEGKSSPPGSSPPIGGASGPPSPAGGKSPPVAGSQPEPAPPVPPKAGAPEPPAIGKAPTPATVEESPPAAAPPTPPPVSSAAPPSTTTPATPKETS